MRTPKKIQKIIYFSENRKTQKILECKILDPKKLTRAYVCLKISEYPPPPPPRPPPSPPPPPPSFIRPIYPTDQGYFLTQSWFEMHPLLYVHAQLSEWDMTDMHVIYFVYNSALVKQTFIPYREGKHPIAQGPGPTRPIPYK